MATAAHEIYHMQWQAWVDGAVIMKVLVASFVELTSSGRSDMPFLDGGAGLSRKVSTF